MPSNTLILIAQQFQIQGHIDKVTPFGNGFINDTYMVHTSPTHMPNYLLQRKNKAVFGNIAAMMQNIVMVSEHIKRQVAALGGDPMRQAMTIIHSQQQLPYHIDTAGDYWTLCLFINNSRSYDTADSPQLAHAGGEGIGLFQAMLANFSSPLTEVLPGFHNIRYRLKQWDKALAHNKAGRTAQLKEEISWIETRRHEMLHFWAMIEDGSIPTRVAHNDTKISNILFDTQDQVLCVIDLDTVQNSSVLHDFGDAIRSYTNTAAEDEAALHKVSMNIHMFEAYTTGYLSHAKSFLNAAEIAHLPFAARYITYEQALRFLMDYIEGDIYYKTTQAQHNLIRTHAQHKLLQSIEAQQTKMQQIVNKLCS